MPYQRSRRVDRPAPAWVLERLENAASLAHYEIWESMQAADRCGSQWIVADAAVDRFEIPRCLMKLASLIRLGHYRKTKPAMEFAKVRAGKFFPSEIERWVNSATKLGWMPA